MTDLIAELELEYNAYVMEYQETAHTRLMWRAAKALREAEARERRLRTALEKMAGPIQVHKTARPLEERLMDALKGYQRLAAEALLEEQR